MACIARSHVDLVPMRIHWPELGEDISIASAAGRQCSRREAMKQRTAMTDDEIRKIVMKVLRREFKGLGFEDAEVYSEEDFDGASIIRVAARATRPVPVARLTSALHELRSQLIDRGEERFVFLDALNPREAVPVDEDRE
jgi:hypothetical protein